jgi:hypothetical protein
MNSGIDLYEDEQLTKKFGISSKECARKAIFETAWSRVFLSFSCMMSPAFIFYLVEKAGRTPRTPAGRIPYEIGVFLIALMGSLPASIAMFPQNGKVARNDLEDEVRQSLPNGITTVYYNKGL